MTNKEALISVLKPFEMDSLSIEKQLIDRNVTSNEIYDPSNVKNVDLAAIDVLEGMMSLNSVAEGGFRMQFDREGVKSKLLSLARKHRLTDIISRYSSVISSENLW